MRRTLVVLAAVGAAHLAAQLLGLTTAAGATQVLLMPVLAAGLWASTSPPRPRMIRVVLAALGLSWLGDAIPRFVDGEAGFLGMLGSFLIAQMIYAIAFWPLRHRSVLRRPVAVLPYVAVAGAIIAATAPAADALVPALVVYAAAIAVMAVLSTGLGRLGGMGGALFVLSDALIALNTFAVLTLPAHGVWVMSTYITAQALLVAAVHREAAVTSRSRRPGSAPPRR